MDPVSMVIASAAAGGIAGKLSERITDHVTAFFARGHSKQTRARAREAAEQFADLLLTRIEARFSAGAPLAAVQVDDRLTDPDFASTLEAATRSAARTTARERHEILAGMVADRLAAEPASVESVAIASAVEILPRLAPLHVEMLGLLTGLSRIRPAWWGDYDQVSIDGQVQWMVDLVSLYDLDMSYGYDDLLHLASAGCVSLSDQYTTSAYSELSITHDMYSDATIAHDFEDHRVGARLTACWQRGLDHARLLPVGFEIGWAVYEARVATAVASGAGKGES